MARFRGTVQGGRTEASRLGHKNTGLVTTTNGWNAGVRVSGYVGSDDADTFDIYMTAGSSGGVLRHLGTVKLVDGVPTFTPNEFIPPVVGREIRERLEYLRGEIRAERISYGELAELQGLAEHIEPGDVELLEWAGVPEHEDEIPGDYGQVPGYA